MLPIEEYLERRGAKYFVAGLMFSYVLGTLIFNIYLRGLGISDFDFLQLRYMFSGLVFILMTGTAWILISSLVPKSRKEGPISKTTEAFIFLVLILWLPLYAVYIFPIIPTNFGGAQPIEGRLVGDYSAIKDINEIIEFETGAEGLPLQKINERSAIGTNIKILDRNQERIWILLTKDLYISSQSALARDIIEEGGDIDSLSVLDFIEKPLLVSADDIRSISFSLYEPPRIITSKDLDIIENVNTLSLQSKETVKAFIKKEALVKPNAVIESIEGNADKEAISNALELVFDEGFLDFRANVFQKSLLQQSKEQLDGVDVVGRKALVAFFLAELERSYPLAFVELRGDENYLVFGLAESTFPKKLARLVSGAANSLDLVRRLNTLYLPEDLVNPGIDSGSGTVLEAPQE